MLLRILLAIMAVALLSSVATAQETEQDLLFPAPGIHPDTGFPILQTTDALASRGAAAPTTYYLVYVENLLEQALVIVAICHMDVQRFSLHPNLTAKSVEVQMYGFKVVAAHGLTRLARKAYLELPKHRRTKGMIEAYSNLVVELGAYVRDNNELMRKLAAQGKLPENFLPPQKKLDIRKF